MRRRAAQLALALTLTACGGGSKTDAGPYCGLADGSYLAGPCPTLSDYGLVTIEDGGIAYAAGVVPYDLNTPLFSDYAIKERAVWLPPGTQATYDPVNAFAFPQGTILIKSFGFPDDDRKASPVVTWVETRLLVNTPSGWQPNTYLWDAAQRTATLFNAGEVLPITWTWSDGGVISANYLVPTAPTQCEVCHDYTDDNNLTTVVPIGPKARELNKNYPYASGPQNELTYWTTAGILSGAPSDPTQAPALAVWDDPTTGTLDQRARAYLEANCGHCHNAGGTASTSGLFLLASEAIPTVYGVCKAPVAAGPATGGFSFDIVPGDPDHSIVIHRLASTTPSIMMPQLGRSVVDEGGLDLVTEWIAAMDGGCG